MLAQHGRRRPSLTVLRHGRGVAEAANVDPKEVGGAEGVELDGGLEEKGLRANEHRPERTEGEGREVLRACMWGGRELRCSVCVCGGGSGAGAGVPPRDWLVPRLKPLSPPPPLT